MSVRKYIAVGCFAAALYGCNGSDPVSPVADPVMSSASPVSSVVALSSASTTTPTAYYYTLPTVANPLVATNFYNLWKTKYYRTIEAEIALGKDPLAIYYDQPISGSAPVAGSARILWDKSNSEYEGQYTVSEGIGYGMILTYFANDPDAFLRLWGYHKAWRLPNTNIMDWQIKTFSSSLGGASATDADLDVATALLLGYKKWQNPALLNDALLIIASIWDKEIDKPSLLIRGGDTQMWDAGTRNPSYFSPVAFRLFAEVDPLHDWAGVLNANYAYMEFVNANGSGLFPDWADNAGVPKKPENGSANGTYSKYYMESIRIPWRLAWDYGWYGDPRAKTILTRMANFIIGTTGGDVTKIQDRYVYSGTPVSAGVARIGQIASFCAVGMVDPNYMAWANSCTTYLNATPIGTDFNYFHHILQTMYAQLLNGQYVKP